MSIRWIFLALISCSSDKPEESPEPIQSPTPIKTPAETPIPITPEPELNPNNIGFKCATCKPNEKTKLLAAQIKANKIVQSQCFKDFMMNWGLIWTNGKTPEKVVEHLRTTKLTVPVHYYDGDCNVIGYRQPPYHDIYFNRCSHDFYNSCDTASNAVHEWSHVLEYDHPFERTNTRGKTVPYAINNAFDRCCSEGNGFRNDN